MFAPISINVSINPSLKGFKPTFLILRYDFFFSNVKAVKKAADDGSPGTLIEKLLKFLTAHEQVSWVRHPFLPEHPQYKLAKKMLPKGAGSIITFGIKGGRDAGRKFIEAVSLSSHLANVGDAKTLVIHPASTTHSHIDSDAMKSAGLTDDMIRLSVGLEDISDIVSDFEQGLKAASKL